MTTLARTLCVLLCVAFPSLTQAIFVHAVRGVGCISVNRAGTCSDGPPSVPSIRKPVEVSPDTNCSSGECKTTLTITFGWDEQNRKALTGKPGLIQEFDVYDSWSHVSFFQDNEDGCLGLSDENGLIRQNEPLICSESQLYNGLELPNPYHALADYNFDVYKELWVPNEQSPVDSSSSSNLVPPADAPDQSVVASSPELPPALEEGIQVGDGNNDVPPPGKNMVEDLYSSKED